MKRIKSLGLQHVIGGYNQSNARSKMIWDKMASAFMADVKLPSEPVNNYIGVFENGSTKRKGAYEYDMEWHQNAGGLVIAKVAEKVLVDGAPIRETVEQWPHIMDFMLRTKVPRSSHLGIEKDGVTSQLQNITRYYVAKGGGQLVKYMPPLAKKPGQWRKFAVESGWGVQPCNDIKDAGKLPVDFDYYIKEVEKLCLSLK